MTKIEIGHFACDRNHGFSEKTMKVTGHDGNNHLGVWYENQKETGPGSIPNERVEAGWDPETTLPISIYTDKDC
ncbi:hypothetical protein JK203_14675 [Gluconobacter cerinus]|uniref:hypothetical protein n=1 Tax=Gluconobacter cerinus TaxID=38307 RepID=UPI001B8AA15A|nr:hypothetical protein [Gluconobacter cerinus]MBS1042078.1 hypothetical protein [Gluconobacter cerinus]MBS1048628.1 hypothetical protein [Gluconobacter cerinus]